MALNIPGGEFLTGSLDVISQSLTIPVLVILLVIVIITIISLGGVIAEYTSRRKVPVGTIRDLIYDINAAGSVEELKDIISAAKILKLLLPNSWAILQGKLWHVNCLNLKKKKLWILCRKLILSPVSDLL